MHGRRGRMALVLLGAVGIATLVVSAGVADPTVSFTNVPHANTKSPGYNPANLLSPQLQEIEWARGSMSVDNPSTCPSVAAYGYLADGRPFVPVVDTATGVGGKLTIKGGSAMEAQKTEPDKNTYLVLKGQSGADGNYNYGTHFLYQGHEGGSLGYLTRVNLDADGPHRVTVLACKFTDGTPLLNDIDGSTWDPWASRLLFTSELSPSSGESQGGVMQSTLDGQVVNLQRYLGRGGF